MGSARFHREPSGTRATDALDLTDEPERHIISRGDAGGSDEISVPDVADLREHHRLRGALAQLIDEAQYASASVSRSQLATSDST